ncbi:MAG: glycosyltransferase [Methanoregula sp.]
MDETLSSKRYIPPFIDLNNTNNSHTIIINLTGHNKNILELGTSTGYISKILEERGNRVTGIEIDKEAGSIAQQFCDRMIIADIELLNLDEILETSSFDVILCGDILEHLKKPETVLKRLRKFLKPDGYIVVSLPNFFHGDVLLNLLNGDFHYTSIGLLDETHLRFFGLKNIYTVFTESGYQIANLRTTNRIIGTTELMIETTKIPRGLLKFIQSLPDSTVYQYIFTAHPSDSVIQPVLGEPDIYSLFFDALQEYRQELHLPLEPKIMEQIAKMTGNITSLQQALSIWPRDDQFEKVATHVEYMDEKLAKKNQQIQEITTKAQTLTQAIIAKDQQLQEQTTRILSLEQEISSIETSIVWQLMMKFHTKVVERLLPRNTWRRRYYSLGLKGGGILVNQGFSKLYWHFTERKRVKKIESQYKKNAHGKKIQYYTKSFSHARVDQIKFPEASEDTEISIIIPVHNKIQYTLNCLKSISFNTTGSFEVVVIDDASNDETESQLKNIENIKLIRNTANLGFVESCNKGAKSSKGKYLLFLNNDTIVAEEWLPPLLDIIKKENVGAVGSKLIYPDGRLQEAGGIIWNDASGYNYGKGDNPNNSQYNYIRDVDYCSGAALIIKKEIFAKLGGFDTRFKPGYYEDTDLCFSIRNLGYRVLYQPRSIVIHYEGISNGTDISTGIKKYQEINRIKFFEKWKKILTEQHYESGSDNVFNARIRQKGKKILVIDHYVPTYDKDAGSYRMCNLLKILVDLGYRVTFIGDNLEKLEPYTTHLQKNGIEVIYYPTVQSIEKYLIDYGKCFEIVLISRPHIAIKHLDNIKKNCKNAKIIFDTVDLQFLRERRRAEIENDVNILIESEKLKNIELLLARRCDLTLVVSQIEKELLLKEDPSLCIDVLSTIHEVKQCDMPFADRKDLMFLGGFVHLPNIDAMRWFVKEIFPHIMQGVSDIKLYIIGSNPPQEIENLAFNNIVVVGYCEDLTPYFNNCRVFIAPLRYGAGVKGKINQSMSYGLPVVTTPIGAEGMNLIDGNNVLIGQTPVEFAKKVLQIYKDKELWETISKKSIENVDQFYSFSAARNSLNIIMAKLI